MISRRIEQRDQWGIWRARTVALGAGPHDPLHVVIEMRRGHAPAVTIRPSGTPLSAEDIATLQALLTRVPEELRLIALERWPQSTVVVSESTHPAFHDQAAPDTYPLDTHISQ